MYDFFLFLVIFQSYLYKKKLMIIREKYKKSNLKKLWKPYNYYCLLHTCFTKNNWCKMNNNKRINNSKFSSIPFTCGRHEQEEL